MQLQPNMQTGSIAGTPHAARRGGASQTHTRSLMDAQTITNNPAGKAEGTAAIDAGDQAGDRHGDGRQPYDTFQRSDGPQQMWSLDLTPLQPESDSQSKSIDFQA